MAAARIARARGWLNDAAPLLLGPLEAFAAAPRDRDLSLFYLFLAIPECIDIAAHQVAAQGWGAPDDAGSAFDILAERELVDRTTATTLRGAVVLRFRIAHGYALLDHERVHREAATGIPALRVFLSTMAQAAAS